MKKLKIAEVGTIWERTPPKLYGGTERVVYELTEALAKKGHDVTLFATGDSKTSAKLKHTYPRAAYRDGVSWENFLYPFEHISHPFLHADKFDIIHVHLNKSQDYVALILADLVETPVIFTIHFEFPISNPSKKDRIYYLLKYKNKNFVSISNAQRTLPLNFVATVHNGLDFSSFKTYEKPGKDLVWIGRFSHQKGPREAIEVAKRTGLNLILAGKIDRGEKQSLDYYTNEVAPHIDGKQIMYIGEVNDIQKIALLKKAKALLMPINWNEPFGLTTIEAMACGVPVIAFNRGPMREIIMDGKTGFIVKNVKEMAAAVKKVDDLNRPLIAKYARSHFGADVMANKYIAVFEKLVKSTKHGKKHKI